MRSPHSGDRVLAILNRQTGDLEDMTGSPRISSLAVSPDGRWVAEGGVDKRVRVLDGKSLQLKMEFRAHEGEVMGVAWHPRFPLLATSENGLVRIWDSQTWRMVEELHIPSDGKRLWVSCDSAVDVFEPAAFQN